MGLLLLLAVVALGAIVWLLFRTDAKLQAALSQTGVRQWS